MPLLYCLQASVVLAVGMLTMCAARICALCDIDLKKVVAFRTLRQIGLLFTFLCLATPVLTLFHLLRHAFFKARLFIGVGVLIHNLV